MADWRDEDITNYAEIVRELNQRLDEAATEIASLRTRLGEVEWQPIETAPRDRPIQAKIPGHGSDNIISWQAGFRNSDDDDCCCWVFVEDQEPPDSWTDGVCWEVNEDGVPSVKPTHWKPLPA